MGDIEPYQECLFADVELILPKDEIKDVEIKAFKSEDPTVDGSYVVRITKKNPTIEILCGNEQEAYDYYKWLRSYKKIIKFERRK